jgi:aryl-alcohol dehydrogenase-like predicted oxidoreductase
MEKRLLGKTGLEISPVTFGGIIEMNETQEDANKFVAYAIERGVNYFDVAPSYGNAELKLGPALHPYRKQVYLACKTQKRTADEAKKELLQSLKNLQTDHFDVYQLHAMTTQEDADTAFGPGGVMETFLWAKKEGLVNHIGFSTHSEDIALHILDLYDFESVLFPMQWALGIVRGWGDRISERVKKTGAGLLAMKTLIHRSWLEGEERNFPKSWCKPIYENDALGVAGMKYGLLKGATTLVPPGNFAHFTFMLNHIDECLKNPLSEAEWKMLRAEAEKVKDHLIF